MGPSAPPEPLGAPTGDTETPGEPTPAPRWSDRLLVGTVLALLLALVVVVVVALLVWHVPTPQPVDVPTARQA
jgi:hypothetical protein